MDKVQGQPHGGIQVRGVLDTGTQQLIWIMKEYPTFRDASNDRAGDEEAEKWLKENFPDYKNPIAYWD